MAACLRHISTLFFAFIALSLYGQDGQLTIGRVESMPNQPSPYNMRDWRDVALKYDAFVFDSTKEGEHLPLVFFEPAGISYPERPTFGLDTYVGTFNTNAGEAINILPALVGASLVGVDKTDHLGENWILMAQDFFRRGGDEFIYLNNRGGRSGNDWWYDMMPNIFFYQLYDIYGPIGDFDFQFNSVADQMLTAVRAMGGSDTPWTRAFMNYRAWRFSDMTPNEDGVEEPEAAGAYAWLLYHAYIKTQNEEYLKGAEWSMEYLANLGSNPSYELQLPYGAYIAARMNAELNTSYPIDKLLFWVFNRGPIRGWGNIVGEWGGLDVSGLVGEANDGGNDYAFQLNGVQQGAAIVPLVRYDKRFARTVGKWMVNMANATRLMYPGFLPSSLQDASDWSEQYDPDGVIGYEALREQWEGNSPFSTGDALRGGWAATNLALYGSSSIGYLGALIEETDVEMILKVDLLATDFFRDEAYPSYLLYNPYQEVRTVMINVGDAPVDIYDALTESFIATEVNGDVAIEINGDEAISIVLAPAGAEVTYEKNKMMLDGIVVDYRQSAEPWNGDPRIQALAALDTNVVQGDTIDIWATAIDLETKTLLYDWEVTGGELIPDEEDARWVAPAELGQYLLTVIVTDEADQSDTAKLILNVVEEVNIPPVISTLAADKKYTAPSGSIQLTCEAFDDNKDALSYVWSASNGTISGSGTSVTWTAPSDEGIITVSVTVTDGNGGSDNSSIRLLSYAFEDLNAEIVAMYPFNGNANDESGNGYDGDVSGAKLTDDRNGGPTSAYFFDGVNDNISVANEPGLNFQEGITLSVWVRPQALGEREVFILSHGSWQNRWKLSVTPERSLRWTVKSESGPVRDLDSEVPIEEDRWYHVAATYDGELMALYLDGKFESATQFSGLINPTTISLEIGQMLPDEIAFNFRGEIDDISIFDQALTPDQVAELSGISSNRSITQLTELELWPNPARELITVRMPSHVPGSELQYHIIDETGRIILYGEFESATGQENIRVDNLDNGSYFIILLSREFRGIAPFIIMKHN